MKEGKIGIKVETESIQEKINTDAIVTVITKIIEMIESLTNPMLTKWSSADWSAKLSTKLSVRSGKPNDLASLLN